MVPLLALLLTGRHSRSSSSATLAPCGRARWRHAALVGTWAMLGGCAPSEPTEIVAGVHTQMQVPRELSTIGVVVQSGGSLVHCLFHAVDDGTVTLPSTLGMQPTDDPTIPVTVGVVGYREPPPPEQWDCLTGMPDVGPGDASILRRRRLPYAEERTLYLPMPLRHACVDQHCDEGETCIGGQCQAMELDPTTLADYLDGRVFGDESTCFDAELCVAPWASLPATVVDRAACVLEIDPLETLGLEQGAGLNVIILHDDFTPEVLDLDPLEGFTIPDPSEPWRFQLAPSLCQSRYATGKITGVWASPLCPSKTPLQPLCRASQQALLDGTTEWATQTVCQTSEQLQPSQSALYVVMDRSAAMGQYFGPAGFERILSLSFDDPAFQNTLIAFKLAPGDAGECNAATTSFAALTGPNDVPFTLAAAARDLVAEQVRSLDNVLADNPPVLWDVVMSAAGAYRALQDPSSTTSPEDFHRRGLLLIGNRDFYARCDGAPPALAVLASFAADGADELRTYVVLLDADETVDQGGHDPATDAQAIAYAGRGQLWDARADASAGAAAMLTLAGELGACLYERLPAGWDDATTVSYLDPLTMWRTDIPRVSSADEASCIDETSTPSGWALDSQDRVRICGWACTELRSTMQQASAAAAQLGNGAPPIPLHAVVPCSG